MSDFNAAKTKKEVEAKATQLPRPQGYHILCAVPSVDETYGGGLVKAETAIRAEEHSTLVLFVIALGPDAYKDKVKFPSGPWCKAGDFVLTRAYSGTRLMIHGKEFRVINDDSVEAVVDDPRGIGRV